MNKSRSVTALLGSRFPPIWSARRAYDGLRREQLSMAHTGRGKVASPVSYKAVLIKSVRVDGKPRQVQRRAWAVGLPA